jgi:hypothetical protein
MSRVIRLRPETATKVMLLARPGETLRQAVERLVELLYPYFSTRYGPR